MADNQIALRSILYDEKKSSVLFQVETPSGERAHVDICCVIDVSGSMNDEASLVSDKEQTGLSVLDIVKHSVKTIIHVLGPKDRLSIVSYSTDAKIELPLTEMSKDGQKKAEDAVKKLKPEGHTNLWGGLKMGLDVLKEGKKKSHNICSVMLLTDGMPNIVPPEGHMATLRSYQSKNSLDCIINTFGFGYTLDSKLLNDIAIEGNGSYGFIPDSSFVGTIFVNSLSNLLATRSTNSTFLIEPSNGTSIVGAPGVASAPGTVETTVGGSPSDIELDLVFVVDCTGSMSSYIHEAQKNINSIVDTIITSERADVKFGLVSYRDHPPQEKSYITHVFPLTGDHKEMKKAVDTMKAAGGGDCPEAVATGMRDACEMKFREGATKVVILIADAPPHGLGVSGDGFPNGEPNGVDPLKVAAKMGLKGIALYSVGCEPAICGSDRAVAFMRSVAQMTGGRYVPLQDSKLLSTSIIGSCREELSLFRVALPVLRAVENANGDLKKALSELESKSVTINILHFEDPFEENYKKEVQAFVNAKDLAAARESLKNIPAAKTSGDKKLQVSVKESSPMSVAFIQRIVNKYSNLRKKLEERDSAHQAKILAAANSKKEAIFGIPNQSVTLDRTGPLQFGQPKSVLIKVNNPSPSLSVNLTWKSRKDSKTIKSTTFDQPSCLKQFEMEFQFNRTRFIEVVSECLSLAEKDDLATAQSKMNSLIEEFKNYLSSNNDAKSKGLLEDLEGEVTKALSRLDWFKKWGIHYLPSLLRAHQLQLCNNFKDPGVQNYGGEIFTKVRDTADDIFLKLPPPEPSLLPPPPPPSSSSSAGFSSYSHTPARVDMGRYYDSGGVCFGGKSLMMLEDGSEKLVEDIKKGDRVKTHCGVSTVRCVVKSHVTNNLALLVSLSCGLTVTPWHPILSESDEWIFPCEISTPEFVPCSEVYNFVLDSDHVVIINGVKCVTLGHQFTKGKSYHAYFGSALVVENLMKFPGWDAGQVDVFPDSVQRSQKTGMICGLVPSSKLVMQKSKQ